MKKFQFLFFALPLFFMACGDDSSEGSGPTPSADLATIGIEGGSILEGAGASMLQFEIRANRTLESNVDIDYTIAGVTATPDVDFTVPSGSITMAAGSNSAIIAVPIIDDEINEVEERMTVTLTAASNANISGSLAVGVIRDNDNPTNFDAEGYVTPDEYFGYELSWADEFTGDALNMDN